MWVGGDEDRDSDFILVISIYFHVDGTTRVDGKSQVHDDQVSNGAH